MKIFARMLCLLPLITFAAVAETYPKKTLVAGSMVCFKIGDWRDMVEASLDQDEGAAERLISSGKCRTVSNATKVGYVEAVKFIGDSALVQLPSGKTAFTADGWLR